MTAPLPTFNHEYIENTQLIDRYVLGKLDMHESEWFDNHFPECDQCLEALELSEAFLEAMRRQQDAGPQFQPPTRSADRPRALVGVGLALAAGLLMGLLLPKLGLFTSTMPPVQEAPYQVLIPERSTPSQPQQIAFYQDNPFSIFTFPTPENGDSYQLTFRDEANQVVYRFQSRKATGMQKTVLLNRKNFKPGLYRLDIEIIEAAGQTRLFAQHLLQITYLNG